MIMEKKPGRIIILGDSWGCGEWPEIPIKNVTDLSSSVSHKGLQQYFLENGHTVVNLSVGGGSNIATLERLKQHGVDKTDTIFWIQTDPTRDLGQPQCEIAELLQDCHGSIIALRKKLLDNCYQQFNQIDTKIYVIGGLQSIDLSCIKKYQNLIPLVVSWPELLVGNLDEYKHIDFAIFSGWNQHWTLKGQLINDCMNKNNLPFNDVKTKEALVDELLLIGRISDEVMQHELFYPDGAHPNRKGHKILFDYIKNKLKL
jgi:hypothetical protein